MNEKKNLTKAAGVVGFATLLSRILGFLRDMITAYFVGASMAADAFFVAFRIPNLLRRLVAEGALTIAFVPVFTEYLTKRSKREALELAGVVFTLMVILLTVLTILGVVFAPAVISVLAPGFVKSPSQFDLAVSLTRIMFPYIFFISLVSLMMGMLNSLNHFAAPALAPCLLNLSMIGSVYLLGPLVGSPVYRLAWGVIIGGVTQLALQVPFLIQKGAMIRFSLDYKHPAVKKIFLLFIPAAMGAGVYQINVAVGTLLASMLPQGSVSYLYFADRILEFPLGIFAVAVATAILPSLSRHVAGDDMAGLGTTFSFGMRLVLFITVPAMVGLIVLRRPIVALLFMRGRFTWDAVEATASALLWYSVGLAAIAGVRIVVNVFYALQDTATPVKVAALSLVANIFFSLLLMGPMQYAGLALANSLSAVVNLGLLAWLLHCRLSDIQAKHIVKSATKVATAAGVMGLVIHFGVIVPLYRQNMPTAKALLVVMGGILLGMIVYGAVALALKSSELRSVMDLVTKRIQRFQRRQVA
ncbi:MAG: murein biosynthesis integral membrane protein MurJ [Deltaproteobacteria bacterium]|nr:murein biosynthesis integral membrane protein MurJ [Deltaproteobacteria bacterium]